MAREQRDAPACSQHGTNACVASATTLGRERHHDAMNHPRGSATSWLSRDTDPADTGPSRRKPVSCHPSFTPKVPIETGRCPRACATPYPESRARGSASSSQRRRNSPYAATTSGRPFDGSKRATWTIYLRAGQASSVLHMPVS